jgi:hypothetical protein
VCSSTTGLQMQVGQACQSLIGAVVAAVAAAWGFMWRRSFG